MEGRDAVNLPPCDAGDVIVITDDDDGDKDPTDLSDLIHGSVGAHHNFLVAKREVPDKDMQNDEDTKQDLPVVISDDDDDPPATHMTEESRGSALSQPQQVQEVCAKSDIKFPVINAPVITGEHLNEHFITVKAVGQQNEPCPFHTNQLQAGVISTHSVNQIVKLPSEVISVYNQFLQHSNMSEDNMDSSQKTYAGDSNVMPIGACDPPDVGSSIESSRSPLLTNQLCNEVKQQNGPKKEEGCLTFPTPKESEKQGTVAESDQLTMLRDKHSMYLKQHTLIKLCTNNQEKICYLCDTRFYTRPELVDHMKSHLNRELNVPVFKCVLCCQSFGTVPSLKVHVRFCCLVKKYADASTIKCLLCDAQLKAWALLEMHLNQHRTPMDYNKFKCLQCNEVFETGIVLQNHNAECQQKKKGKKSVKKMKKQKDSCATADANRSTSKRTVSTIEKQQGEMNSLLDTPSNKKEQQVSASSKGSDMKNVKNVPSKGKKTQMQKIYVKQEGAKMAFMCSFCLYSFQSKISLERHVSRHLDVNIPDRVQCLECQKLIERKGMVLHVTSHTKTALTQMKCPVQDCCVLFRSRPDIEFHLREQHSMNIMWLPDFNKQGSRNYDNVQHTTCCYMCFLHCSDILECQEHIRQHSCDDNQYKCLNCSKSFVDPDKLRSHTIRVHFRGNTSSPCPCIIEGCSFTWVRIDMFKTHMFKDHSKAVFWIGSWESERDHLMAREEMAEIEEGMAVEKAIPVESSVGVDETITEEYSASALENIADPGDIPEGEMQIYNFCATKVKSEESELQPGDAYLQEFSLLEPENQILKSEMQDLQTVDGDLEDFSLFDTGSNELESEMQELEPEDAYLQELSLLEPRSKKIKMEMQE